MIPTPPVATPRRIALLALLVTLIVVAMLVHRDGATTLRTLGDTDDAMRLVMVRELLHGKGWFDQQIIRLQPPEGLWPHWSRLLDGGLAALYRLFALFAPPAQAERLMRIVWPLLWIFPAVLATLATAGRLGQGRERVAGGARAAIVAASVLLVVCITLYSQFRPNRIDHHDAQIAFCVLSFAGLARGGRKGGVLAGAATALGMAVGLEAAPFEALVGAGFAWRFVQDPKGARDAKAYGLALAGFTLAAFLAQTPPVRWAAASCDALSYNLLAALVAAGLGMALSVQLSARRPEHVRLAALVPVGLLAAALYTGLDVNCLKGPFADVDPRIKPIWLDHVQEVKPWLWQLKRGPDFAYDQMVPAVMGLIAWLWLGFAPGRKAGRGLDALWLVAGLGLLFADITLWSAIRAGSYVQWLAAPLIAAAIGDLNQRYLKGTLIGVLVASIALSPAVISEGAARVHKKLKAQSAPQTANRQPAAAPAANRVATANAAPKAAAAKPKAPGCFDTAAWTPLAGAPAGLALSEVDLGPFILANTQMSAVRAPYHRMSHGIYQGYEALKAPADGEAEAKVRALGVDYLIECPSHGRQSDRDGMKPDSLQKRLDAGKPPAWVDIVVKTPTLILYRLKPAATP